jgi:ribosomal protein L32
MKYVICDVCGVFVIAGTNCKVCGTYASIPEPEDENEDEDEC